MLNTCFIQPFEIRHVGPGERSAAAARLVEQGMRPRVDYLSGLTAEILDCPPSDPRVLRGAAGVRAQSLAYLPNVFASRLGLTLTPTPARLDKVADHIAGFSLGGTPAVGRAVHAR